MNMLLLEGRGSDLIDILPTLEVHRAGSRPEGECLVEVYRMCSQISIDA